MCVGMRACACVCRWRSLRTAPWAACHCGPSCPAANTRPPFRPPPRPLQKQRLSWGSSCPVPGSVTWSPCGAGGGQLPPPAPPLTRPRRVEVRNPHLPSLLSLHPGACALPTGCEMWPQTWGTQTWGLRGPEAQRCGRRELELGVSWAPLLQGGALLKAGAAHSGGSGVHPAGAPLQGEHGELLPEPPSPHDHSSGSWGSRGPCVTPCLSFQVLDGRREGKE
uniref:Uncharacterized protein n=1 Tax=Myotis myotis TaxID=51298 RepID=A0A7J7WVK8_MYOMY|nr:hypothetical protein mMyoMyo1_011859 [Myotis myotis]